MKVQSTKQITSKGLADGKTLDFDSSQEFCDGIAIINVNANKPLYEGSCLQLLFDTEEILPELTPISLLQTSTAVAPNQRFFRFKRRDISKRKFTVKGKIPAIDSIIVMLLLGKKHDSNSLR